MKTAVSPPDDLSLKAERAARKLRISRSQLYATAIAELLERRQSADVTARLNEIYSKTPAKIDPVFSRAQARLLERDPW